MPCRHWYCCSHMLSCSMQGDRNKCCLSATELHLPCCVSSCQYEHVPAYRPQQQSLAQVPPVGKQHSISAGSIPLQAVQHEKYMQTPRAKGQLSKRADTPAVVQRVAKALQAQIIRVQTVQVSKRVCQAPVYCGAIPGHHLWQVGVSVDGTSRKTHDVEWRPNHTGVHAQAHGPGYREPACGIQQWGTSGVLCMHEYSVLCWCNTHAAPGCL